VPICILGRTDRGDCEVVAQEQFVRFIIDTSTEFGAKVIQRIEDQKLAWLTTVSADGTPQPNPVWFIWDEGSFVIFSRPNQAKLNNIRRSGRVSFNLESIDEETITIFTGHAQIVDYASIPQAVLDRYAERYAEGMEAIKLTRAEYEAAYTVPIRFTPEKLRGW
jgi:PPOX class probable F420-dependent enzyme